mmetsp:Transcript_46987/g.114645  ORF Transcript_46987/g.114645 Transcript_46987/m.114645 type:complete len:597 (-) Transcript_46987:125-1915(-)
MSSSAELRTVLNQGFQGTDSKRSIIPSSCTAAAATTTTTSDKNIHNNGTSTTPTKRMVTPDKKASPDFLHKPTATNGIIDYQSPYKPTDPSIRYSLSRGVEPEARRLDLGGMNTTTSTTTKTTTAAAGNSTKGSKAPSTKVQNAFPKSATSTAPTSSSSSGNNKKIRKHDPNAYKIFILLLQPEKKTFELIQLVYSPNDTTIGDIITMIPSNATEPVLGNQTYIGLCRPKTQQEITDKELLASESRPGIVSAKITLGEILVAIPEGHTGSEMSVLAKQILSNPKIIKLLKRADPLAPKKSRRSRSGRSGRHGSSSSGRHTHRSRSKEHVDVMEKFDEADEIAQEQQRQVEQAMEHAAKEAAAANAACGGGGGTSPNSTNSATDGVKPTSGLKLVRSMSETSSNGTDEKSLESSLQESLDESYSSWSKSFDASFASSVCSGVSKRVMKRRDREARRTRILKRSIALVFVIMVAFYFLDPRGYSSLDKHTTQEVTESPMGLSGLLQSIFLLLAIYKTERFVRRSSDPDEARSDGKSRCPFMKAASLTMRRFKSRYAKKLKRRKTSAIVQGRISNDDDLSFSRRLRTFSLKGNSTVAHE